MNRDELVEIQKAFASDIAQLRSSCASGNALKVLSLVSETWLSYADGATVIPVQLAGYTLSVKLPCCLQMYRLLMRHLLIRPAHML